MRTDVIHIAYTTNRRYVSFDAISIHSLLESNPESYFHIHILGYELQEEDIANIEILLLPSRAELSVYPMHRLRELLTVDVPDSFPIIAYARLFLASVLPDDVDRVLYLDGDTIVRGDIRQLYSTDLGNNLVGAILDPIINDEYKQRTGIALSEPYINAGVLLIPLDRWRKEHLETKFVNHLAQNNGSIYLFDQGLVNTVCAGRKLLVSPKYDLMTNYMTFPYNYLNKHNKPFYAKEVIDDALRDPIIIHFTGRIYGRPWEEGCTHPYRELFEYHKSRTAYRDVPLAQSTVQGLERFEVFLYRHLPFLFYKSFKTCFFAISHLKHKISKK